MQAAVDNAVAFDPFGPDASNDALYVGPALQQRLDLVEHLLEFGRQLILLSGEAGAGKTTVLAAVAHATHERWRCIPLDGGPDLDGACLLGEVAEALGLERTSTEYPDGDPDLLDKVRQRIGVVERSGKPVVLLLDDADRLPSDALGILLALARTEDQTAEARVLMTADSEHSGLIAAVQRDGQQHGLVHVVEIPRIADEETEDFLRQRLRIEQDLPAGWFSSEVIAQITAGADGNPGRLCALAREASAGGSATPPPGDRAARFTRMTSALAAGEGNRWLRWAPAALLPVALLAWLMRSPSPQRPPALLDEQAQTQPGPTVGPDTEARLPGHTEGAGQGAQRIEITLPPAPTASDPAAQAAANEPPATPAPAPVAEPAPHAEPQGAHQAAAAALPALAGAGAAAAVQTQPVTESHAPKPKTTEASKPRPVTAAPKATQQKQAKPRPKPAAAPTAAKTAPTNAKAGGTAGYTLQLFGVSERKAASGFIGRHQLGDRARIIESRREGKPWFIVVYGNYPSRPAAQNAVTRLPPAVRREVQPWVRDVKSVNALRR